MWLDGARSIKGVIGALHFSRSLSTYLFDILRIYLHTMSSVEKTLSKHFDFSVFKLKVVQVKVCNYKVQLVTVKRQMSKMWPFDFLSS